MNLTKSNKVKPFYTKNLEKLTSNNDSYRKVIFTGVNTQLVLMSIQPQEDIKMEVHQDHDQFIRIEQGDGKAIIDGLEYELKDDSAVIVPAGTFHQIINTSLDKPLKLYTLYSPPEHKDKLVQQTNPDKKKYIKYKNKYLALLRR